ncbi:MAG: hypothetical protein RL268_187 [Pseudomonadota bacterium]|jgi:integrase
MAKHEKLPKYVSAFVDNRGKRRYRFRKVGCVGGYFLAHPNTVAGKAEYAVFLSGDAGSPVESRKVVPGSVDALLALYYGSTDFRGRAAEVSLAKRRAVLEAFRDEHGHRLVKEARYDKLDKYIASVLAGHVDEKGKRHGGPFAAETARKALRGLFRYAVKIGWRPDNPMDHVGYRPGKTEGFHSWTEAEIERYRAHWPMGTKQRLALELMLWTGKRRSDLVTLGPQHVSGGHMAGRDKKTGKRWTLPVAPQLQAAIDAMPESSHLCFVMSKWGRAYSAASFGNVFRDWCDAAGLPHCSSHGLRKAISRRMAELGIGNAGIKAVTLHSRDDEVATYVAGADQKRLGEASIRQLSQWELSSGLPDARQTDQKKAEK